MGGQTSFGNITFYLDQPVAGLENALGKFLHGLGPGPDGPDRPIPLFLELLDPELFVLKFNPGDPAFQVLANDQNRFLLPRSLPPILTVLAPHEDENPTGDWTIARHAYSEGAFRLLHDLIASGHRFGLKEFLRLAAGLAEALAFLHGHGIAHGPWSARSILCVPQEAEKTPLADASAFRFDLLNSGVLCRRPEVAVPELLERGGFARELFPPGSAAPDLELYDLDCDVFSFAAFLRDLFQRASSFEELTRQAARIRDAFHREALRRGLEARPELWRQKEQEILDHLHTLKVKTEAMIQAGLEARHQRSKAAGLQDTIQELFRKAAEYGSRLLDSGFEPLNVFGDGLLHYSPYQITATPLEVNNFESSIVQLDGEGLPQEVIRVTLGDEDRALEVEPASGKSLRFKVPGGFPAGNHPILLNNRRTNASLRVVAPVWEQLLPNPVRKPWPGFGNLAVKLTGRRFPALTPAFTLESAAGGGRWDALSCRATGHPEGHPGAEIESQPEGAGEAAQGCLELEFPGDLPAGEHRLLCNGLSTGLALEVLEAPPEPAVDPEGLDLREVLNHREQKVRLRGRRFHPAMIVDLGEGSPAGAEFHLEPGSDRGGLLTLPAAFPAGSYRLRVNRKETGLSLEVLQPMWQAVQPPLVSLPAKTSKADLQTVKVKITGKVPPAP